MTWLKENERIDELHRNGYRIIQNGKKFCFGMDAVLLSGFASVKTAGNVLDLGTGTGILPILLGENAGDAFYGPGDPAGYGGYGPQKRKLERTRRENRYCHRRYHRSLKALWRGFF